MLAALARLAVARPRRVAAVAAAVAAGAAAFGVSVAGHLEPYAATDPATESARADALLRDAHVNAGVDAVALVATPQGAESSAGRARVRGVARELAADPAVGRVVTFEQAGRALVAHDGRSTYLTASFRPGADDDAAGKRLLDRLGGEPGVRLGGIGVANPQVEDQVSADLRRAELMAFPILFVLAFLVFRSAVAALLPLLVGGMAIVLTMAGLRLASGFGSISVLALNVVTGLGLGLAIDYSLFMVSRHREELASGAPVRTAVARTLQTAGRTVLFSSLTVAAALGALLVFPQRFLYSMGIGGMMVALLAGAVALLVLPAVLVLLGPRVDALAPRSLRRASGRDTGGGWYRVARAVARRPVGFAAAAAALLIALGLPFLGVRFTSVDATVLPRTASARQVDDALKRDFDPRRATPVTIVARTDPGPALRAYLADVARVPGVAAVGPPRRAERDLTLVDVVTRGAPSSDAGQRTVRDLRALDPPFAALARGEAADFVDLNQSLGDHLPIALAVLVAATILVLFLMTGSVVLPVKALVMNALTLVAALGLLVLIFQDGRFEGLLAYERPDPPALAQTQILFLAAVAFGLSTDYGVFLLGRIKEARDRGAPNAEAVATGLAKTGGIVTAAAILFCVAVGAFATSKIVFIKELGVGTALAVLLDAAVVRALLVPSLMQLLGDRNWWAPRPLARLHARFGISEAPA